MKKMMIPCLILCLGALFCAPLAFGQATDEETPSPAKKFDKYDDFIVKGYSITFSAGHFAGATYLENPFLAPKAYYSSNENGILSYFPTNDENGEFIQESIALDENNRPIYDAAHKEVEPGETYTLKVGVYIADNFHLDLAGNYINSRAATTMVHIFADEPEKNIREEVDHDDGFKIFKGGLALMYDAEPAKFWGIVPRLGFGLGGIINRYSELEDKTALYLESNFALHYRLFTNVDLSAQFDSAIFAFQVDELGYSNMVQYNTVSVGLSWFVDVLPSSVRAAHQADNR